MIQHICISSMSYTKVPRKVHTHAIEILLRWLKDVIITICIHFKVITISGYWFEKQSHRDNFTHKTKKTEKSFLYMSKLLVLCLNELWLFAFLSWICLHSSEKMSQPRWKGEYMLCQMKGILPQLCSIKHTEKSSASI